MKRLITNSTYSALKKNYATTIVIIFILLDISLCLELPITGQEFLPLIHYNIFFYSFLIVSLCYIFQAICLKFGIHIKSVPLIELNDKFLILNNENWGYLILVNASYTTNRHQKSIANFP